MRTVQRMTGFCAMWMMQRLQYAQNIPCTVIDFSLTRQDVDLYRKDGAVYLRDILLFEEKSFHVVGDYNLSNAMIAACMAYKLGVSVRDIQKAITSFQPVEHRLEYGEKWCKIL
ncbi:MAG: hypothetical protein ACLRL6_09800 [Clostridium sp.]